MELDRFEENGVQYVQLYASCPTCHEEGRSKPHTLYSHHACGGDMYIGDNATIKCKKCGVSHSIHSCKWGFGCEECNGGPDGVMYERKVTPCLLSEVNAVMSVAHVSLTECGLPWLQRFIDNLESGWSR